MRRAILVLTILLGACLQAHADVFVINGKPVNLPVTAKGGKTFVDAVAFAKALGATITYDAAKKVFVVTTAGAVGAQGAAQMAGEWAEMGKEYSLGKDDPMNFALRSAEFVASRVRIGEEAFFPKADEKLLVLHYTAHNPQNTERSVNWSTFNFTVVDATNANREYSQQVGQEANSLPIGNMELKPAQKVDLYTYIVVSAAGETPKLIVKRGDGPVLRYDLRGKVKALPAPIADPSDSTGSTALKEVPGQVGASYSTGLFDVKVESAAYTNATYADNEPEEGTRHLLVTVAIKNQTGGPLSVNWGTFHPKLVTAAGEAIPYNQYLLHATRDELLDGEVAPGQEIRGRFFFQVRKDDPAAKFILQEGPDSDANRHFAVSLGAPG